MSTFGVIATKIEKVWKHPGADLLDMALIAGTTYQFVVQKDIYKAGDDVIYFPIDAILPDEISIKIGIQGKLAGKAKNRVKTIKLRNEISQGVVCPPKVLFGESNEWQTLTSDQLTLKLGVTKYEPPVIPCKTGNLISPVLPFYDIENADSHLEVVDVLMNQEVCITEKIEGTHFGITVNKNGDTFVSTRNHRIQEIEGFTHDFWKCARQQKLIEATKWLAENKFKWAFCVSLRGEHIGPGVQNNIYKLKDHEVRLFDILVDQEYVDAEKFSGLLKECAIATGAILHCAPSLYNGVLKDWLSGLTVKEASSAPSLLNPQTLREGIVIKPKTEKFHSGIGRLFIKQRDPVYLSKYDF